VAIFFLLVSTQKN